MELLEFLQKHWVLLLTGVICLSEIIVRLTPSQKDNSILNKVLNIVDFLLPNLRKDGGKFVNKIRTRD